MCGKAVPRRLRRVGKAHMPLLVLRDKLQVAELISQVTGNAYQCC